MCPRARRGAAAIVSRLQSWRSPPLVPPVPPGGAVQRAGEDVADREPGKEEPERAEDGPHRRECRRSGFDWRLLTPSGCLTGQRSVTGRRPARERMRRLLRPPQRGAISVTVQLSCGSVVTARETPDRSGRRSRRGAFGWIAFRRAGAAPKSGSDRRRSRQRLVRLFRQQP